MPDKPTQEHIETLINAESEADDSTNFLIEIRNTNAMSRGPQFRTSAAPVQELDGELLEDAGGLSTTDAAIQDPQETTIVSKDMIASQEMKEGAAFEDKHSVFASRTIMSVLSHCRVKPGLQNGGKV